MKTLKKILGLVLVLSLLVVLNVSAMAYDITVYGGNNGTVNGGTSYKFTDNAPLSTSEVQITNDKYYAKGFVLAGRNRDEADNGYMNELALTNVNEDMDYVVVYGVKGQEITYTVNCTYSGDGTVLGTYTYTASEGDTVYAVIPYFDGYAAVSVNGENITNQSYVKASITDGYVFDIVYSVPTATVVTNTVTTTTTTTTNVVNGDGTPVAADDANAAPADAGTTTDNAEQPAETVIEEQQTPTAAPNEDNTVDLDGTDDTPTSNFFGGDTEEDDASHIPVGARYAIAGVGVAAVGVGVFFLVKTLRKKVS